MRFVRSMLLAVLWLGATMVAASAQSDVIRGRVTNTEGQPVSSVRVTATSIPGNVTREAQTNAQGNFQIVFPGGPGDYIMGYLHAAYGFRQMQVKRVADEAVLIADVRLAPIQLDSILVAATVQQRVSRNVRDQDVGGTEQTVTADLFPPEVQGDIAAMAASLPGVSLVPGLDGNPDGFSVMGLDPENNSLTLNGMQMGGSNLPRDAGVSSSLVTSPFDVSRGGFSGGNFNISTRSGSNFRSQGTSLVLTTPQMQWADRAASALGNENTNASLSGMTSGPIRQNKSFYNVSWQLGRQARDNTTLLRTSPLGLRTAGIAPDSVTRFVDLLGGHGVPLAAGPVRSQRLNDSGMVFGAFDFAPPTSASGASYNVTVNGNWRRQTPVGGGPGQLSLESTGGDRTNWNAGLQAKHSAYVKMVLTETSAGVNLSRDFDEAYLTLPAGRVRVHSTLDDGGSGVQTLTFGGNQGLGSTARSLNASFQNSMSWFDNANRHRIKLSTELQYATNASEQSRNLLGSYFYNSLADLEANRPASFTRTLTTRERTTGHLTGSLSLGDSWRRSQQLQLQYGVRVDASTFTTRPAANPLVEATFGRRNDRVPAPVLVSPRIGFSWTYGRAEEIMSFVGAAQAPRAVIRGGIGVFASTPGASQIGQVLDNTGLPDGTQYLNCVGPAVPVPDWNAFAASSGAVPDRCADGTTGTVFSSTSPNVTLFDPGFAPPRSVRSNVSWNGGVLDGRFNLNVDASWSLNLNQQRSLDLNFDATERFALADDGRPVFVAPGSIVPATGAIASRDARVSQEFARVTELRSDLQSRTTQASIRLSPIARGPTAFGWSLAYTFTHLREQVSGFSSTAGDPLTIEWARSGQGPHQFNYSLRYRFFDAIQVNWNGTFRSGSAFTPMVAGDINGDGYSNDRAFIPSPGGDAETAAALAQLLDNSSGSVRRCLERQAGRIADRNSCRGPWTSTANLNVTLDRAKFRMPHRAALSFSVSNPLGAADLLVNGSGSLRGWGQGAMPDQSLLHVRGFDPETKQYRYEVNQRFGATRPQYMTLRSPVTVTATFRYDLGPTRERQNLSMQLASGRNSPGYRFEESTLRSFGTNAILNPLATILRQQDTLRLTALQADSIAAMNRRYSYQADSLWRPVARELAALPDTFDAGAAYVRYMHARRAQIDLLAPIVVATRALLTSEQRRRLSPSVANFLDPRHLALVRNGTGLYISGAGLGSAGGGMPFMAGAVESFVIMRE